MMAEQDSGQRQRVAAILAADVAGYSRLMADDETATIAALDAARAVFTEHITANQGRVVDTAGDSVLAIFETTAGAVEAAMAVQAALIAADSDTPEARRMRFRIGVHLGDIHEKADGTIYGDGVNIAARLEGLAEPGSVAVSDAVQATIRGRVAYGFADLGEHEVKNIEHPVRAFRVLVEGEVPPVPVTRRRPDHWRPAALLAVAVALLVAVTALWPKPETVTPQEAAGATSPDDPALASPARPVVAVLPFDNLSNDPEQDYFVDGLTEEIIAALTRFDGLGVIARNSTFTYKGRAVDVREVATALGADYVVEGSMRKAAETIRVTVQLLDATSGGHVWAETYERQLTAANLFAVQDDITGRIVATLADSHGAIVRAGLEQAEASRTDSLDIYECMLRHNEFRRRMSAKTHLIARDCLESAVEREPDNAEAWARLANVFAMGYAQRFNLRPAPYDALALSRDAAQTAAELDPANAWALLALVRTHYFYREPEQLFLEAERAVALNPNNADVLASVGWYVAHAGRWEWGLELVERAMALSPFYPNWYHQPFVDDHYRKQEYEAALVRARQMNIPGLYFTYLNLAFVNGQLGRHDDAKAAVAELLAVYPNFAAEAYAVLRKWYHDEEHIAHIIDGLRKAGLDIPNPPEG